MSHFVTGQAWDQVNYFCTTRLGGASQAPYDSFNVGMHTKDNPEHVLQNRALLRQHLPTEPLWLNQVHGTEVFDADTLPYSANAIPDADAAVTTQKALPLVIMTADCLPVVFASSDGLVIGAAHAGWRGLLNGVLENTVELMLRKNPGALIKAWIGPCIQQASFEVGAEVLAAFCHVDEANKKHFIEHKPEKYLADLPAIALDRLNKIGVHSIENSLHCTYEKNDLFYSYRRQAQTGRLATCIYIK